MSNLTDFLHPIVDNEEKEIFISKRFVKRDEKGEQILGEDKKPILRPFKIRTVSQEENDALIKAATRTYKNRDGSKVREFDRFHYSRSLVVAATVDPDFRSTELCQAYGVLDPLMVPGKMLYAGEYQKLADEIAKFSGIDDDGEAIAEDAKN